ncbi:hypothetical protein TTRE_0000861701, partial [Trichuris trichiura]
MVILPVEFSSPDPFCRYDDRRPVKDGEILKLHSARRGGAALDIRPSAAMGALAEPATRGREEWKLWRAWRSLSPGPPFLPLSCATLSWHNCSCDDELRSSKPTAVPAEQTVSAKRIDWRSTVARVAVALARQLLRTSSGPSCVCVSAATYCSLERKCGSLLLTCRGVSNIVATCAAGLDGTMETIKKARTIARNAFSRACKRLEAELAADPPDLDEVQVSLSMMNQKGDSLAAEEQKFLEVLLNSSTEIAEIDKAAEGAEEYTRRWLKLQQAAESCMKIDRGQQFSRSAGNEGDSQNRRRFRLPKLELKRFN